jgi:phosphoglucomutase
MPVASDRYRLWITDPAFDESTREELLTIRQDPKEIEDRFYKYLEFGTAGLRGILGAGTNRMNQYTVARASEGFARHLDTLSQACKDRGVAISYDSRHFSQEYALLTARIFAAHGLKSYLSDELRPVPMLSFAIRHYRTIAGVMITASHNPARYNGYKAYGEDGGQLPPEAADGVSQFMDQVEDMARITIMSEHDARQQGWIIDMGEELDRSYNDMLLKLRIDTATVARNADLKIIYSPLHGTGNKPVRRILKTMGFKAVHVVPEQELPDPDFSTVVSPNPEERSALKLAILLAQKEAADLVIATDPDADRTGLCVRAADGEYQVLTGNQIGLLVMDYILSAKQRSGQLLPGSFVVTTIVSTKLTRRIAEYYGVKLYECLTGFKFIAEIIENHDEKGSEHFQFGFEESFGYLAGLDVRDKDAVVTSMLIAEMAASARDRGQTLYDALMDLYRRFGFAAEQTISIMLEGKEGIERIKCGMTTVRAEGIPRIPGVEIVQLTDYLTGRITVVAGDAPAMPDLPPSDVLLYTLPGGLDWFCIRPSGTEPKIKIYFGFYGNDLKTLNDRLQLTRVAVESYLKERL